MNSYAQQKQDPSTRAVSDTYSRGPQSREGGILSVGPLADFQASVNLRPQVRRLAQLQQMLNPDPHAQAPKGVSQRKSDTVMQRQSVGDIIRVASKRLPGHFVEIVSRSNNPEDNKYRLDIATLAADIRKLEGLIANRSERMGLSTTDPRNIKLKSQIVEYQEKLEPLVGRIKKLKSAGTLFTVKALDGSNPTPIAAYREELGGTPVGTPTSETKFKEELNRHTPFTYIPSELAQTGPPAQPHIQDILQKFVAFRGDSRSPAEVFKKGFSPREQHVAPIYRYDEQDIHNSSAIAASRNPAASALFPLPTEKELAAGSYTDQTYLYAFVPDTYINTHEIQEAVRSKVYPGGGARTSHGPTASEMAGANLYGAEIAVMSVPGAKVVAAWVIRRKWAGATYREGCTYKVQGKIAGNPNSVTDVLSTTGRATYYGNLSNQVRSAVDGKKSPSP